MPNDSAAWPPLPLAAWADTCATLHMWTQIVGKIRLALAPPANHWWNVTLYLTARGLTTSPLSYRGGAFEIRFDFIDHTLVIETSEGDRRLVALAPQSVAEFYARVRRALDELHIAVHIWPMPMEVPAPIRFDQDRVHASYDPEYATRFWQVLLLTGGVMDEFRARFIGKSSPVHFFWGSFDLAVTRFSGRRAPPREGADAMTREGYSHEVASVGFWPGTPEKIDAAFYAYAAPEPAGFKTARVRPGAAFYGGDLNIFILKYDDVRTAASPRDALLEFFQSTYDAAADLGTWDRVELERLRHA